MPKDAIAVIPLSAMELKQRPSDIRRTSGNSELDRICGGRFFRNSIQLSYGRARMQTVLE